MIENEFTIFEDKRMSLFNDKRKIIEVFPDRKYQLVREAFDKLKIRTVDQVTDDSIMQIIKMRGFGDKKKQSFLNIIAQLDFCDDLPIIFPEIISTNEVIKSIYSRMDVEKVILPAVSGLVMQQIDNDLDTIKDISTMKKHKLIVSFMDELKNYLTSVDNIGDNASFTLQKATEILEISYTRYFDKKLKNQKLVDIDKTKLNKIQSEAINQIIYKTRLLNEEHVDNIVFEDVKNQDKKYSHDIEVLKARSEENKTLQEIGDNLGVTRERVRQIEKKIRTKFTLSAENNLFFDVLNLIYFDNKVNTISVNKLTPASRKILNYIGSSEKYNQELLIYGNLKLLDRDELMTDFLTYIGKNPGSSLGEILDRLNNLLLNYKIKISRKDLKDVFIQIAKHSDKIIVNNGNVYSKFTKKQMLLVALEEYLQEHNYFELNLENLKILNETIQDIYLTDIYKPVEESMHPFEALMLRLAEEEELIRIDRKVYKFYEDNNYPKELLLNIKKFLLEKLKDAPEVSYKAVAKEFFEKLKINNITDFEIYYVLKNNLSSVFDFGRQNTMSIRLKDSKRKNTEEVLLDILNKNKDGLSVSDAQKILGWDEYTVRQTVSYSDKMSMSNSIIKYKESTL